VREKERRQAQLVRVGKGGGNLVSTLYQPSDYQETALEKKEENMFAKGEKSGWLRGGGKKRFVWAMTQHHD